MKIYIASDHGGYHLKTHILSHLRNQNIEVIDLGCDSTESVDYPDYAIKACQEVQKDQASLAILVCGTGIGMSMAANRMKDIRAAVVSDTYSTKMTRAHNDANVLCLGERVLGPGLSLEIVDTFLKTKFEGDRHQRRIDKISELDNS